MYAGVEEGSKRSIMQKKLDDMTMMITQAGLVFGVGKSFMFVRHENQSPAHMYSGSTPRCMLLLHDRALLLLYCCFTAALLLLYCCFTAALLLLLYCCCFTAALLLLYCCYDRAL
jgi:hypothetical protein